MDIRFGFIAHVIHQCMNFDTSSDEIAKVRLPPAEAVVCSMGIET